MKRIVIRAAGGFDALEFEEAADPVAGAGQVLVEVRAAGVNFADCIARMGLYASAKALNGWPLTPGFEIAGVVRAVGAGVTDLAPGDAVIGVTIFNAQQSLVALPRGQLFRLPAGWSFAQGAGFPTAFLTAWYALHELAVLRAGQTLLVHSAAGGVGQALCQLGRRAGAEVIGVVGSPAKILAARAAGATHVIDKSGTDLWAAVERLAPQGVDAICDANGPETLKAGYDHLAPGGKLVVYGFHTMFARGGASGRPDWLRLALGWLRTPRFSPLDMTTQNRRRAGVQPLVHGRAARRTRPRDAGPAGWRGARRTRAAAGADPAVRPGRRCPSRARKRHHHRQVGARALRYIRVMAFPSA